LLVHPLVYSIHCWTVSICGLWLCLLMTLVLVFVSLVRCCCVGCFWLCWWVLLLKCLCICSLSRRSSLILSLMWISLRLWMRLTKLCTLKALGSCITSFSVFVMWIAHLYMGLFFQLTVGQTLKYSKKIRRDQNWVNQITYLFIPMILICNHNLTQRTIWCNKFPCVKKVKFLQYDRCKDWQKVQQSYNSHSYSLCGT
jgi:hypothetical protein